MRKIALRAATSAVATLCLIAACSKKDEQPPPAQPGQYPEYQQQPGYPAAGQQQYPQQQPYPQQQQPYPQQYPQQQQQPYPASPAPGTAPGATSQPSAVAFPCQTDVQCLSHRCNMQVGKCAWPCQSNDDCQPGFQCVAPACVPLLQQPQ